MANTAVASLNDRVPAEVLSAETYETARAQLVGQAFCAHDTIQGSNIKSYTRYAKLTAAALTEGTDGTATEMTDTTVSLTLGEIGIGVELNDTLDVASSFDELQGIAQQLAKAFVDKVEIDVLSKASSLTDSVGTTLQALTEDVFLQGIYEVSANDVPVGDDLIFIGYPKQLHNLRTAIGGTTDNSNGVYTRPDVITPFGAVQPGGWSMRVHKIDCYESTNVPSATAGADSKGMFMRKGKLAPIMLAVGVFKSTGQPWWARTELDRNASMRATEIWVTGYVATGVPAPESGCGVLSVR